MVTALETVDKLTVRRLMRGLNQAATLTAEHAVRIDDVAALPINEEVTYTDEELGFVFRGRIVTRKELWRGGEGIVYECSDVLREISKTPATINSSTKIEVSEPSSAQDLIQRMLDEYIAAGGALWGHEWTDWDDFDLKPDNKGGQTIFEWISSMLGQTPEGITYVKYDAQDRPMLQFTTLDDQPDFELKVGEYKVADPVSGGDPLLENAEIGETMDRKYSKAKVEGCGEFERFDLRYIAPTSWTREGTYSNYFVYRFNVPEEWITDRFVDRDGRCHANSLLRIGFGFTQTGVIVLGQRWVDIPNPPVLRDDATGEFYWEVTIVAGGLLPPGPPPLPQIQCWFTYTGYKGPLATEVENSGISNEGTILFQHPELYKFSGSDESGGYTIDMGAIVDEMASKYYERYCMGADRSGTISIHIAGLNSNIELGARIIAPTELDNPRVREISYDFIRRSMALSCSDTPLRPSVEDARTKARLLSELQGNWYLPEKTNEPSCFCGGPIFQNQEEHVSPRTGAWGTPPDEDEPDGPSWDCIQGECIERADDWGQYLTLTECERSCHVDGYDFVPCTGCVPSEQGHFGQYETMADCTNANPDPFASQYNCGSGGPQSPPPPEEGKSGVIYDCAGCSCGTSSSSYFMGFVKRIKVGTGGNVIKAECETCEFDLESGYTGQLSVLCEVWASWNAVASQVDLTKCFFAMSFKDGLLVSVSDECGSCYEDEGTSSRKHLLTDACSS